jgi:hypothetical protein
MVTPKVTPVPSAASCISLAQEVIAAAATATASTVRNNFFMMLSN